MPKPTEKFPYSTSLMTKFIILGVSVCLPCLVSFLQNRLLIVTTLSILKCNKNKFMFGKLHCVFKENTLAVLNFGAVYTITKSIYVFCIKGSEYIQFFASPYPPVTANRSGP